MYGVGMMDVYMDMCMYVAVSISAYAQGSNSHHGHGIVVKDGRHVFGRELIGGVADEEAGLAHGSVADDDAPVRRRVSVCP